MKFLKTIDINDAVFIDIETSNAVRALEPNTPLHAAWEYKNKFGREPIGADDIIKSFEEKAALFPEFGAIRCITIGKEKEGILKLKSFVGEDEKELLTSFSTVLETVVGANKKTKIVGWAIIGFDIPWIVRRCIVNGVKIPSILDIGHLKPWNYSDYIIDLMDVWKGGAFNGSSLIATATALGLENPKEELAGYQTSDAYYNDPEGLVKIEQYCCRDVHTTANIFHKCRYEPLVEVEVGEIKIKQVGVLNRVYNAGEIKPDDEKDIAKKVGKLKGKKREIAEEILGAIKN